jgi:four helix bundle protein
MTAITRFEEIDAWKSSRQLTNMVYAISNQIGFNKDFGLRDQIRRAAVSVMSNAAEGFESRTNIQFINFLGMARASSGEVRAQLYIALDQKYISEENSKNFFLQKNAHAKSPNPLLISNLIPVRGVFLIVILIMRLIYHPTFDLRLLT